LIYMIRLKKYPTV